MNESAVRTMPKKNPQPQSSSQSVALCGLTIALMAVSAWITIPIGPVPFTLQTFVMVFCVLALTPRQALASVGIYIVMGAAGLPVFSGMRGGAGILMGATGGFIWGFFAGAVVALLLAALLKRAGVSEILPRRSAEPTAASFAVAVAFIGVCYVCGWAQLMVVAACDPLQAFVVGVAPFIIIDAIKVVAAVFVAAAVKRAIG